MADVIGMDPVAWSIDGGRHRAELFRILAYAATGGGEGVVSGVDCKVRPLTTAGTQIRFDSGAVVIRNRSANVRNQSYVANNRTETRLDIAPNNTGTDRYDAIIVRIEDPAYAPWPTPAAGAAPDYQYAKPFVQQNVGINFTHWSQITGAPATWSAYALARVRVRANTNGTITEADIVDLRNVAQPAAGSDGDLQAVVLPAGVNFDPGDRLTTAQTTYRHWPANTKQFFVPYRATHVQIMLAVNNILVAGPQGVDFDSQIRFGTAQGPASPFDYNGNEGNAVAGAVETRTHHTYAEFDIRAFRGTWQTLELWARRTFTTNTGQVWVRPSCQWVADLRYSERPVS